MMSDEAAKTKACIKCNQLKPSGLFAKCKRNKDGLYTYCRQCLSSIRAAKNFEVSVESKKCSKCNELKSCKLFTARKSNKDGLSSWCKKCTASDIQKRSFEVSVKYKACSECKKVKACEEFTKSKKTSQGFLECVNNVEPMKNQQKTLKCQLIIVSAVSAVK